MTTQPSINKRKIVVFTGAGISAESGLPTFRDADGLWERYNPMELATTTAWSQRPEEVLEFYNERKRRILEAHPNAAHEALVTLEQKYEVIVITQNIDNLHERAGSSHVIHLHGQIVNARSSTDPALIYNYGARPMKIGELCDRGSQIRPHVVLFGETIENAVEAIEHIKTAGKILVVGTSLSVYPAAGLLDAAHLHSEKVLVSPDLVEQPLGFTRCRGTATDVIPVVTSYWMDEPIE